MWMWTADHHDCMCFFLQYGKASMHKAKSMKTLCCVRVGVQDLQLSCTEPRPQHHPTPLGWTGTPTAKWALSQYVISDRNMYVWGSGVQNILTARTNTSRAHRTTDPVISSTNLCMVVTLFLFGLQQFGTWGGSQPTWRYLEHDVSCAGVPGPECHPESDRDECAAHS